MYAQNENVITRCISVTLTNGPGSTPVTSTNSTALTVLSSFRQYYLSDQPLTMRQVNFKIGLSKLCFDRCRRKLQYAIDNDLSLSIHWNLLHKSRQHTADFRKVGVCSKQISSLSFSLNMYSGFDSVFKFWFTISKILRIAKLMNYHGKKTARSRYVCSYITVTACT